MKRSRTPSSPRRWTLIRYLLAGLFLTSGMLHMLRPGPFVTIVPPWLPDPQLLVSVSGVAEVLGGVGLLQPHLGLRRAASVGLGVLLIAVFPANIHMAANPDSIRGLHTSRLLLWARLPLQPLMLWFLWKICAQSR